MHSPWISRVLSELGHEVIVAHARNVSQCHQATRHLVNMGDWVVRISNSYPTPRSSAILKVSGTGLFLSSRIARRQTLASYLNCVLLHFTNSPRQQFSRKRFV